MTVIERHKLEPVNGEYHFTAEMAAEMMAEAVAINEAEGTGMNAEKLEDLLAVVEGKPQPNNSGWEQAEDDVMITDDEEAFCRQLRRLLKEQRPHYWNAVRSMAEVMMEIAKLGLNMEDAEARKELAMLFVAQERLTN
jgi:hypothetical protein